MPNPKSRHNNTSDSKPHKPTSIEPVPIRIEDKLYLITNGKVVDENGTEVAQDLKHTPEGSLDIPVGNGKDLHKPGNLLPSALFAKGEKALEALNVIRATAGKSLINVSEAPKDEKAYIQFIKNHYVTFFTELEKKIKEIGTNVDQPLLNELINELIPHVCALQHNDTYKLFLAALDKKAYIIAEKILTHYPKLSNLCDCAKTDGRKDLLNVMLECTLRPSSSYYEWDADLKFHPKMQDRAGDIHAWVSITRKLIEQSNPKDQLDAIHRVYAMLQPAAVKFSATIFLKLFFHRVASFFCCLYMLQNERPESVEEEKARHRKEFLVAWAYEKTNKEPKRFRYTSKVQEAGLAVLSNLIEQAESLDELHKLYEEHVNASYFMPHRSVLFSLFSNSYSSKKIEFIEQLQEKAASLATNKNAEALDQLLKSDLFSPEHQKHGLKINHRETLVSLKGSVEMDQLPSEIRSTV